MCNTDIRNTIKQSGLKQWQVAEAYGLSEGNFCRMLRRELSDDKKQRVYEAIEALKGE